MAASRRAYIDWLRGIAVVAMIEWHVIDSWSIAGPRDGTAWVVIRTVGGYAAPLFLFLAGLAVPLAIRAREKRGMTLTEAAWSVQKRGWQIFGIAHVFRFLSFFLNPNASWTELLKPDILNVLGLGLAATAFLGGFVGRAPAARRKTMWWLLLPAVAVLAATPLARLWWWPTLLIPQLEAYIRPVGNFGVFSLFPWLAYVPFGAFLGVLIVETTDDRDERTLAGHMAAAGIAAGAIGAAGVWFVADGSATSWIETYSNVVMRAGVMTAALAVSRGVVAVQPAWLTNPLLLLGQTSLFVYWVHVELAYGVWSLPLHHTLPLRWSVPGFAGMLVLMYFAAGWWAGRPPRNAWIPVELTTRTPHLSASTHNLPT